MKILLKALLLTTLAAISSLAWGADSSPEKVAKNFVEKIYSGNTVEATEFRYFPPKSRYENKELVQIEIDRMSKGAQHDIEKYGMPEVSVGEAVYINSDKTKATVKVTLNSKKDGQEHSDSNNVSLIKTEDGWRIDMSE